MLRPAGDGDVDAMRAWRNQAANRAVSINAHEISAEEHAGWWSRTREDPTRRVLVFELGERPLGIVSFFDIDDERRRCSWGFYLDSETVEAEGLALMAWMQVMKEATTYAFDELGVDTLDGEVLAGNEAVRSMNRRFRFTEGPAEAREVDGRTIEVHPISLRREDRRGARKNRTENSTGNSTEEGTR